LGDVYSYWLFAVSVFACVDRGGEVLDVEDGRGGDLHHVHVFGTGEGEVGVVAVEGEARVDGGMVEGGV
jgi:hypothetical protein